MKRREHEGGARDEWADDDTMTEDAVINCQSLKEIEWAKLPWWQSRAVFKCGVDTSCGMLVMCTRLVDDCKLKPGGDPHRTHNTTAEGTKEKHNIKCTCQRQRLALNAHSSESCRMALAGERRL